VAIYKRGDDTSASWLTNYDVWVGNDPVIENNSKCPGGPFHGELTIPCALNGRYLTVQRNDNYYLCICEVEAFEF